MSGQMQTLSPQEGDIFNFATAGDKDQHKTKLSFSPVHILPSRSSTASFQMNCSQHGAISPAPESLGSPYPPSDVSGKDSSASRARWSAFKRAKRKGFAQKFNSGAANAVFAREGPGNVPMRKPMDWSTHSLPHEMSTGQVKRNKFSQSNHGSGFVLTNTVSRDIDGSQHSTFHDVDTLQHYTISITDISLVNVDNMTTIDEEISKKRCWMTITTVSDELFELVFQSQNSRDVLLAFLRSCLSLKQIINGNDHNMTSIKGKGSTGHSHGGSFDMDDFEARKVNDRLKGERASERFHRKITHIAGQLREVTLSVTDCFCCQTEPLGPMPKNHGYVVESQNKAESSLEEKLSQEIDVIFSYEKEQNSFFADDKPKVKLGNTDEISHFLSAEDFDPNDKAPGSVSTSGSDDLV